MPGMLQRDTVKLSLQYALSCWAVQSGCGQGVVLAGDVVVLVEDVVELLAVFVAHTPHVKGQSCFSVAPSPSVWHSGGIYSKLQ